MQAALVILDGWGLNPDETARDAVRAADTPNVDRYREVGAFGTLRTSGRDVGLPDGQMGNSEVGHLTIGAGRIVRQEYARIDDAIAAGTLGENESIASAFEYAREHGGCVHFLGLVSDGGVHADRAHLHALIRAAADADVPALTHAFTDGRDASPTGGAGYLADLQATVDEVGTGDVATVTGRYYAMDRDENWERTRRAYDAIVDREADWTAPTAVEAVRRSYERGDSPDGPSGRRETPSRGTDEFVEPTLVEPASGSAATAQGVAGIQDGDAVVFFNFRADRARQLTRMLADIRPEWPFRSDPPEIRLATMTGYDETFDLPVAFPSQQPEDVLGGVVADRGLTQLRIAETEKYAHVTYFLNGGREVELPGETRRIVPSPDVPTYDRKPEMSAHEVTDAAIRAVEESDPDVLVLNYANPDMVGHTGDYEAAIAAVEAVDEQLGRLVPALGAAGATVLVTADHGNADDMGTEVEPLTAHTTNPVPFIFLASDGTKGGKRVREGGALRDAAPTLLSVLGIETPAAMTGESLLVAE